MGESARGGEDGSVGWGRAPPFSPSAEPLTSPFVEDASPAHAVWGSWGARQRDIFVLDRWGRLVYKENLTPGFDKVVLRRAILSALDGAPAPSLRRPSCLQCQARRWLFSHNNHALRSDGVCAGEAAGGAADGGAGGSRAAVAAWGHAAGKAEEIARGQEGDDSMQPLRAMTAGRHASGATTPPLAGPA